VCICPVVLLSIVPIFFACVCKERTALLKRSFPSSERERERERKVSFPKTKRRKKERKRVLTKLTSKKKMFLKP
jgi:hypothetical protein